MSLHECDEVQLLWRVVAFALLDTLLIILSPSLSPADRLTRDAAMISLVLVFSLCPLFCAKWLSEDIMDV